MVLKVFFFKDYSEGHTSETKEGITHIFVGRIVLT